MDKDTARWWEEKQQAGAALVRSAKFVREQDSTRLSVMRKNVSIYLNRHVPGLDAWSYTANKAVDTDAVRLNLAKSVVDTVHAQLTKAMPRTVPMTEGATWSLQRAAKRLETFIEGVKYRNNWRVKGPEIWKDAEVFLAGCAKVCGVIHEVDGERIGRILIERVYPWEIFVDAADAHHGEPRVMYQIKVIDRRVAAGLFPDHADAIMTRAHKAQRIDGPSYDGQADQVVVVEGWHLPSYPGAKDGHHFIAIEGLDEPVNDKVDRVWDRDRFPIVVCTWSKPRIGMWGDSLVEEVRGIHAEVNELQQKEQAILAQTGRPIILNFQGSDVDMALDDSLAIPVLHVNRKGGADPEAVKLWNPPALNGELAKSRAELINYGYQFPGVSQMSASSMKPAGLDAAVAIREFHDLEAERFAPQGKSIEELDLAVSCLIVDEARRLHEKGATVEVSSKGSRRRKNVLERIKWSEVDLDESAYELQVFPASQLPRQPAGRLAMVEQLIAAGFLDKQTGMRLLDFPDVEAALDEQLAPINLVLDIVDIIMEEGRYIAPIPEQDLQLTISTINLAIQRYTIEEAPLDRISLLRRHAVQAGQLIERAQQEAQAQAQAQAGAFVPQPAGQLQTGLPQGAVPDGQAAVIG